MELNENIRRRN